MYVSLMPSRKLETMLVAERQPVGDGEKAVTSADAIITVAVYDDVATDASQFLSLNFDGLAHLRSFVTGLEDVASRIADKTQTAEPTDDDDDDDDRFTPHGRGIGTARVAADEGTAGNPVVHPSCERCGNHPCTCTQSAAKEEYAEHGTAD